MLSLRIVLTIASGMRSFGFGLLALLSALSLSVSGCGCGSSNKSSKPVKVGENLIFEDNGGGPSIFNPVYCNVDLREFTCHYDSVAEEMTVYCTQDSGFPKGIVHGSVLSFRDGGRGILFLVLEVDVSTPGKMVIRGIEDTWYGVENCEKYRW